MSVELFWRDLGDDDAGAERLDALSPRRKELCAAPLGKDLETWLRAENKSKSPPVYVEDPLTSRRERRRRRSERSWVRLDRSGVRLRPDLTLLFDISIGGYDEQLGFVGKEEKNPSAAAVVWYKPTEPAPHRRLWTLADASFPIAGPCRIIRESRLATEEPCQ
jgi:hypothetical protein